MNLPQIFDKPVIGAYDSFTTGMNWRAMDRLLWMHCFTRAVETGSFSAVARELRTGQPNVSRQIAALEKHLGVRLLHRSTRQLTLTAEGERYYIDARGILDATEEAESKARGNDTPAGRLRIACPTVLGRTHLLPQLARFMTEYPDIELDVQIGDRFIDLVEEGVDVAVRIGFLKNSALRARKIGMAERICVASPAYLERHPAPAQPEDLTEHDCVLYAFAAAGNIWSLSGRDVEVKGRITVNSPDGVLRAVVDGIGIGNAPVSLFERALREGRVLPLLLDFPAIAVPIHLVYPAQRLLPLRAKVFMDFVAGVFGAEPALNDGRRSARTATGGSLTEPRLRHRFWVRDRVR